MSGVYAILVFVAIFGFLIIGIYLYKRRLVKRILNGGHPTKAIVYQVMATGRRPYYDTVHYRFHARDGKQYSGKLTVDQGNFRVNDPVDIFYLPANPKYNTVKGAWGANRRSIKFTPMKKTLLLLLLIPVIYDCTAQVEEIKDKTQWTTLGELKWLGTIKAQLQYSAQGGDTTYLLYLKDETILQSSNGRSVIKHYSIRFNNDGNALNDLRSILFSFFEEGNAKNKEYDKTFRLGATMVNVQHYSKLATKGIMFYTKEGYTVFSKRELNKLFGSKG